VVQQVILILDLRRLHSSNATRDQPLKPPSFQAEATYNLVDVEDVKLKQRLGMLVEPARQDSLQWERKVNVSLVGHLPPCEGALLEGGTNLEEDWVEAGEITRG